MTRWDHINGLAPADQAIVADFDAQYAEAIQAEADRIPEPPAEGQAVLSQQYGARRVARWREEDAIVQMVAQFAVGLALIALFWVGWSAMP